MRFRTIIILFLFYFSRIFSTEKILLNDNWLFQYFDKWFNANVPGVIHTDLFRNKIIPDPFIGANEKTLQWIDLKEWNYKKTFDLGKDILENENIELVFDGIDTHAKIYLNDSLILKADNMFRSWRINCKNILKENNNELKIIFSPAQKYDSIEASKLNYNLPQNNRTFSRKAQFQYGWDFAPKLVTCGIWKNVYLETWNNAKINSLEFFQDSLSEQIANVGIRFEILSTGEFKANLNLKSKTDTSIILKKDVELKKGINLIDFNFQILNPKLWWTKELGEQNLYNYICEIISDSIYDKKEIEFGLRTIKLMQEKDSIGTSFYFKLNGKPIFIKGANYVPQDMFLPRVTKSDYEKIILKAVNANMNMLRVWGGGVYPDDEFYKLCDRFGILVWQDFMFANSMVPGDSLFIENVKEEIIENVKNIRNHPSLAIWCGNNEVEEGWFNWGWQNPFKYSSSDLIKIWSDYKNIFQTIIPEIINQFNPATSYISSSPKIGWGNSESLTEGDMHYWGVWWGNLPFEEYEKNVPRFMSEFGFQSSPSIKSMNKFIYEEKFKFSSHEIKNHQKHPRGFKIIESYLRKYFRMPRTLTEYVLVTQNLQSFGVAKAIEAHRRAMPKSMGTMFWQLNEPCPGFTWSAIDYYGEEKILYKTVSNLYKPFLVSVEEDKHDLYFFIVSDFMKDTTAQLEIILFDLKRKFLKKYSSDVFISANSSKIYFTKTKKSILGVNQSSNVYLEIKLKNKKRELLSMKKYYFVKPKDLYLSEDEFWNFLKHNYN